MTDCAAEWAGEWGRDYTARNRVDWRARIPFWRGVLDMTGARSVYEVGCNAGFNLTALRYANPLVEVGGCEVNKTAMTQARHAGLNVDWVPALDALATYGAPSFDLVATCGVLIHVPPDDLKRTMEAISGVSANHVLAVEYEHPVEQEVEYRGRGGLLWRRPYGELYQSIGLTLVSAWDAGPGFDRCTASLLRVNS